jgi:hypothetical protein
MTPYNVRMALATSSHYRAIRYGVETLASGIALPRHRHTLGYATVVLAGVFEEASFSGAMTFGVDAFDPVIMPPRARRASLAVRVGP